MADEILTKLGLSRDASGWIQSSREIILDENRHDWKQGDRFIQKSGEGDIITAVEVSHGNVYYGGRNWIDSQSVPARAVSRIRNYGEVINASATEQ